MPNFNELASIRCHAEPRRYPPDNGTCVTLGDLAAMVEDEEDLLVCDAKSGHDVTGIMLKQIIVERVHHD